MVEFDVEEGEMENNAKDADAVMLGICPWVKKNKKTCVFMTVYVAGGLSFTETEPFPLPRFNAVVRTTTSIHYKKI